MEASGATAQKYGQTTATSACLNSDGVSTLVATKEQI